MTRVIFVFGGVISGVGKGICAASFGTLLKARGFKVSALKLDPYLNVDPGVLGPQEHGEVFVTEDGLETDLDLGHYERFLNQSLTKVSSITSGKIYQKLVRQERAGFYKGKTVQIVPHFTNEVRDYIEFVVNQLKSDFLICEIGGTVGDMESDAFLMGINDYINRYPERCLVVNVTYIPFLDLSNEFKTKPTQVAIRLLQSKGLRPEIIILRSKKRVNQAVREKIANFCGISVNRVIPLKDLKQVYRSPLELEKYKLGDAIFQYFKIPSVKPKLKTWREFVSKLDSKVNKKTVNVLLVGKYIKQPDSYKSLLEALKISSAYTATNVRVRLIDSEELSSELRIREVFKKERVSGVVILPGFGYRGWEGKINVAAYLLKEEIPTLGICFGFQAMVVAQSRAMGISLANSSEFIEEVAEQVSVIDLIEGRSAELTGATLRLGSGGVKIAKETQISKIYGQKEEIRERFRHRYNVNPSYLGKIVGRGFIFSGYSSETGFIESCELKNHSFYIGVQFHPEFRSRPLDPHPLFNSFLKAVREFAIKNEQEN